MNSFNNTPGDYQSEVGPLPARFWLYFLLLVALAALLLPACHRPPVTTTAPAVVGGLIERDATGQPLDSLSTKSASSDKQTDKPGPHGAPPAWGADASAGRARLFGLFGKRATPSTNSIKSGKLHQLTANHVGQSGGKCKGCTIYYQTGTGNTATTTTAGKKAAAGDGAASIQKPDGPTASQGATATDYTKQGQRGGAAASGAGASATATTTKAGFPWGRVAAGVVGTGFLVWVLFFGGWGVLAAAWRRRSSANQA